MIMQMTLDPNLFTQIGLDSGSLTMLGAVIHSFRDPGEYRGVVRQGEELETPFYISSDKKSAVAQVSIDLASLTQPSAEPEGCCAESKNRFIVNPKGYVVFYVSAGAGGYTVQVRKAEEDPKLKIFDNRELQEGDLFSAIIIRPGTYSITNLLTKAKGQVTVAYPKIGKTPYRPPNPVNVDCTKGAIEPENLELQPAQGLNFNIKVPSRIKIDLLKADDGPSPPGEVVKPGWKKMTLPKD